MRTAIQFVFALIIIELISCVSVSNSCDLSSSSMRERALQASREKRYKKYLERFDTLHISDGLLLIEVFDFLLIDNDIISIKLNGDSIFTKKKIQADSYFEYLFLDKYFNNSIQIKADDTGDKLPATIGVRFPYVFKDTFYIKLNRGKSHYFIISCDNPRSKPDHPAKSNPELTAKPKEELHKGRILNLADSLTLKEGLLRFSVKDYATIDYDSINVYLDDSLILRNIRLTAYDQTFEIKIDSGSYILCIQAINEGYYFPNTTGLSLKGRDILLPMISDQRVTSAIKIKYKTDTLDL